ncbi:hypothetical protein ERJ75_001667800 [Trypanosoma vivax]|nr:hypothetical protein TRVL_08201 [Trypanosoma vivax]KAH8605081.1 hypothetical protein ERJ75_001667800 [Trypanosoma vivax]
MRNRSTVPIALDCEFIKTKRRVLVGAVAFVPFFAGSVLSGGCRATEFSQPVVLTLEPGEAMRHADVLPCGHCLQPLMQNCNKADHPAALRKRRENTVSTPDMAKCLPRDGITLLEVMCPHSIPNIRRTNEAWMRALHVAPVNSTEFQEAVNGMENLRSYGKGRRKQWALSFMAWRHPQLLQDVLRKSFCSADSWCAWLHACADETERELRRLVEHYKITSSSWPPVAAVSEGEGSDPGGKAVMHMECKSLEELSRELSRAWRFLTDTFGKKWGSTKFYAYGNADAKAIRSSMELCEQPFSRNTINTPSALPGSSPEPPCTHNSERHRHSAAQPEGFSFSPKQAKVLDVTHHPLFAASGFCVSPACSPPLTEALRKAATVDATARELLASMRPHDPLWDAKALACISVVCGIGSRT